MTWPQRRVLPPKPTFLGHQHSQIRSEAPTGCTILTKVDFGQKCYRNPKARILQPVSLRQPRTSAFRSTLPIFLRKYSRGQQTLSPTIFGTEQSVTKYQQAAKMVPRKFG